MSRKYFWIVGIQASIWTVIGTAIIQITKHITAAMEAGSQEMLLTNFYRYVGLMVVGYTMAVIFDIYMDLVEFETEKNLFSFHVGEAMHFENNRYDSLGTGHLTSVLNRGVHNWSSLLTTVFQTGIDAFLQITFSFVLIYLTAGTTYLLIAVGAFGVMLALTIIGAHRSQPWRRKKRKEFGRSDKQLVKMLMTKFEMLLNGKIGLELANYREYFENIKQHHHQDYKGILVSYRSPKFILDVLRGAIYFYVGFGVFAGTYTIADFVLLITVVELLRVGVNNTTRIYRQFVNNFMYVERLRNRFDGMPRMKGYKAGNEFSFEQGTILIDGVSFSYPSLNKDAESEWNLHTEGEDQYTVFENFSLKLEGGKKHALVGMSGSGKSTLIKLIAGYFRPDRGSVLVDKQDLKKVSLKSYYQHIGYLTQGPSVFDGTLRENLTYAVDLPEEELKKRVETAIALSKCRFVYEFPQGLQTEVGERGIKLSGGQRQRVAIAKIFIKDPEIVLLDEPTSALDSFNEEEITEAMHNLYTGRTVIIIAHRLQTVKDADDIIVMEEGNIIERGTHAELAAEGKIYKKMIDLQGGF